jgi:hypothetical protein
VAQGATLALVTEHSELYFDLIPSCLSEAARRVLDAMNPKQYEYQSEFARRYFGQGKEQGLSEGRAEVVLRQLALRFEKLSEMTENRIRCANASELNDLAERLLGAGTLSEALGELG